MSWTDERVETLKRMWNEGQSASQIAKELGGVTRNAVIGKVHRLGLSNRIGSAPQPAGPATTARSPTARPAAEDDHDDDASDDDLGLDDAPAVTAEIAAASAEIEAPEIVADDPAGDVDDDEDDEDDEDEDEDEDPAPSLPVRKLIIPAGQPLPPQPSLNEISPEALAKVNEVEKTARRLTLMELTEKTCKWPVGDPATENFWFCGLPVQQGKPYCEAHVGVAFQPMSARRDRRR